MPRQVEFTISWTVIAKLLLTILVAYLLVRLWPLIELLLLALLIAIAFNPVVRWAHKHHWPHWASVLLCAGVLFGFVALLVTLLIPTFTGQGGRLIQSLPSLRDQWMAMLPQSGPIREIANQFLSYPAFGDPEPLLKQFFAILTVALSGVVQFFLVLIVAIYFIADGPRVYRWLIAFLARANRRKLDGAAAEVTSVRSPPSSGTTSSARLSPPCYAACMLLLSLHCFTFRTLVFSLSSPPFSTSCLSLAFSSSQFQQWQWH